MVSAALLDKEYVLVEESVVDDLSEGSHGFSEADCFEASYPELDMRDSAEN